MHDPSSRAHMGSVPWALLSSSTEGLRAVLLLQPSSAGGIFSYSSRIIHRK